jgi:hypothetical protein
MDKIKDLLKQLGASEELSTEIISEMIAYKEREKTKLDEAFTARLNKAKQVCLEEFQAEKQKMARKVEVFLESRVNQIDREARRQSAIGESESTKMLRDVKCLIEGIPVGGTGKEIQAVKESENRLRARLDQALKECKTLKEEAERANTIAMKVLQRNRILEQKGNTKNVTESKENRFKGVKKESAKPKTTRPVLTESQVRAKQTNTQVGDPDVQKIAAQVDDTPAFIS